MDLNFNAIFHLVRLQDLFLEIELLELMEKDIFLRKNQIFLLKFASRITKRVFTKRTMKNYDV